LPLRNKKKIKNSNSKKSSFQKNIKFLGRKILNLEISVIKLVG